jgi:hypothetical protein
MWNQITGAIRQDRVGFFADSFKGPLGIGNNQVPAKTLERFERMAEAAEAIAVERAVQIFTHYDFSEILAALGQESDVPVLILHGDSDAGAPVEATIHRIKQMIPRAKINLYENAGHSTKASSSPHSLLSMKRITNKCRSQSLSSLIPKGFSTILSSLWVQFQPPHHKAKRRRMLVSQKPISGDCKSEVYRIQ